MMPRRERARLLLRGLAKLIAVIVVAGLGGVGLGIGLSKLSGGDEPAGPAAEATTGATRSTASTPAASAETTTTAPPTITTTTPRPAAAQGAGEDIEVTVGVAVLRLASTPSGKARNRARLRVSVTVRNRGSRRLVLPRPSLLAARQRVPTDPAADEGGSRLGPIAAGQTQRATLQFETAGAVTEQLSNQQQARVLVGDRSYAITVTLGPPVSRRTPSDTAAP